MARPGKRDFAPYHRFSKAEWAQYRDGEPMTLAELVSRESLAYRAWRTPEGDFLARQLDRLAQLIRFTQASDGEEHEARMDVMEECVREEAFNRGYAEGQEAGRRSAFHYAESLD